MTSSESESSGDDTDDESLLERAAARTKQRARRARRARKQNGRTGDRVARFGGDALDEVQRRLKADTKTSPALMGNNDDRKATQHPEALSRWANTRARREQREPRVDVKLPTRSMSFADVLIYKAITTRDGANSRASGQIQQDRQEDMRREEAARSVRLRREQHLSHLRSLSVWKGSGRETVSGKVAVLLAIEKDFSYV